MTFFKFLFILILGTISLFPCKINAQPPGDGWMSLEDFTSNEQLFEKRIKGKYEYGRYSLKEKDAYNIEKEIDNKKNLFIYKIAIKDNMPKPKRWGHIGLDLIENLYPDSFSNDQYWTINEQGDISKVSRDGRTSSPVTYLEEKIEDGWKIYQLPAPAKLRVVTVDGCRNIYETGLLENIYVQFTDYRGMLASILKQKALNHIDNLYTTPQEMGWNAVKTEKKDDGSIIEHYEEGIRFIKKSNGDFASFLAPKNKRNEKTLDIDKGIDQPLDNTGSVVGAYKYTFNNGVKASSDGLTDKYELTDGTIVELNNFSSDKRSEYRFELKGIDKTENFNKDIDKTEIFDFTEPLIPISYASFIEPSKNPVDFNLETREIGTVGASSYIPMSFKLNHNGNERFMDAWYRHSGIVKPAIENMIITDGDVVYDIKNDGIYNVGVATTDFFFPTLGNFKEIQQGETNLILNFDNGDYYKYRPGFTGGDFKITFKDGTVVEAFKMGYAYKYKINYPDGSRFVGNVAIGDFNKIFQNLKNDKPDLPLIKGTFFHANGKEEEFDREKQKETNTKSAKKRR